MIVGAATNVGIYYFEIKTLLSTEQRLLIRGRKYWNREGERSMIKDHQLIEQFAHLYGEISIYALSQGFWA